MSLKSLISNKTTSVSAAIITLFGSTTALGQQAAVSATKSAGMSQVHKTFWFYTLLFLLFCLFIAIVGKVIRIYELTQEGQGKPNPINWNKINGILFVIFLVVGLYGVYWEYTVHGNMLLSEAASEHGKTIDHMFNITLTLTTIVFIVTQIALFTFVYIYKSNGKRKAYYYPHNNLIEKVWTIAPALVLTILVLYGFLTWRSIFHKAEDPQNKPMLIEVTSSQFQWDIRYPGADGVIGKKNYKFITAINALGIDFNDKNSLDDQTADEIVMPVNKPVKFVLTSKDVIHSFYLPHFRVQMNTVPGMTSYFEFTPTITTEQMKVKTNNPNFYYLLLCAKICGSSHYNMQKKIRVVSQEEYDTWVKQQALYLTDDLRKAFNLPVAAFKPLVPATGKKAKDSVINNQVAYIKK